MVRARRITGSKCGKIIRQIKMTEALLIDVLYPKPMNPNRIPSAIKWGVDNESKACDANTAHMRMNGHPDLVTVNVDSLSIQHGLARSISGCFCYLSV